MPNTIAYCARCSRELGPEEQKHGVPVCSTHGTEGTAPLECGCIPHKLGRTLWGSFYCETEQQGYCNFECPHDDDGE